jgi:hypothetical protein
VTNLNKVKNIWIDRIKELNSKRIIKKDLEESIEWGRKYWERCAKNIEVQ